MSQKIMIRRADGADLDAIVAITRDAYKKYITRLGYEPKPMIADYGKFISKGNVWLLASTTGPEGILVLVPEGDQLLLYSIAVRPQAQGKGHGRRLMAFAEECALDLGLEEVILYTNEKMSENIEFYSQLGYEKFERQPHPTRQGSWLIFMRKRVTAASQSPALER